MHALPHGCCCLPTTHRFAELAKMVDPSNEPKTDKLSILGEAIRYVQQTQLENSQLRQLNKFLEVRDTERLEAVYTVAVAVGLWPLLSGGSRG
jgi:hypothetical protein